MYTQFYGFSEKPFELTPDPKFLYLSPSHREALASMIYGINERRGFISITGEVGTGKTTLIYTLLSNLSEKVKPIFIYHTTITFEEFLAKILLDLKVSLHEEDKTSLLLKLSDYLRIKMAPEETLAIIIDEGQNLPQETLEEFRMLSNVETSKTKLLQILLVGQPELKEKLNSKELRQLKQRIGLRRSLQPLNPQECREYIEHRLNLVGSSTSKVLTSDAIGLIVHYSKGIPRTINILCDNAFLIGYSFSQKKIDEKIIKEVIEDMENQFIPKGHEEREHSHKEVIKKAFSMRTSATLFIATALFSISLILFLSNFFTGSSLEKEKVVQHKEAPLAPSLTKKASDPPPLSPDSPPDAQKNVADEMSHQIEASETKEPPQQSPVKMERVLKESTPVASTTAVSLPKQGDTSKETNATVVTIKAGETLYSLATRHYHKANETIFDRIVRANPTITDVRRIRDNQRIILPTIIPESYIEEDNSGTYQIHAGTFETLGHAHAYINHLPEIGKQCTIEVHQFSPRDIWYRVKISSFNSKEEALNTVALLKEKTLLYLP